MLRFMRTDSRKFAAALAAAGLSRDRFSALLGISRPTLDRRLSGRTAWRPREEEAIRRLLGVDAEWLRAGGPAVLDHLLAATPADTDGAP
jgi:transcriptional regulator with XRE-family HTH domain